MILKQLARLLFAGTTVPLIVLGADVHGIAARAQPQSPVPIHVPLQRNTTWRDSTLWLADQTGLVLAQAEEPEERRRRRDQENRGEDRSDRRERREERQREQQQRQEERRQEREQRERQRLRERQEQQRTQEREQRRQEQDRQQQERRREQLDRRLERQRDQQREQREEQQRVQERLQRQEQRRQEQEQRQRQQELQRRALERRQEQELQQRTQERQERQQRLEQEQLREQERRLRDQEHQRSRQQERLERQLERQRDEERQQLRERERQRPDITPSDNRSGPELRRGAVPGVDNRRGLRLDELRALRRERVEQGGRRTIIEEQDRIIVREGDRYIIRHDETDRFRRAYGDAQVRRERRGQNDVTIVRRPNGVEIVTIRDADGNLLRRVRRQPDGRQVVLFENAVPDRRGRTIFEEVIVLPPPQITIPRERYIVEVEEASQEDLYEAFTAPPVERIERTYTLDQVRQSPALRDRVRRVDVDTVTFDFGSWELSEEQARALTGVGQALRRAVERNPSEVFLIEGHTDAVGSDIDNLTLSDRRAETVATLLTEMFGVPAENLTTQGYGEQYLKINTQDAERQNRRVTIRRITPLLQNEARR